HFEGHLPTVHRHALDHPGQPEEMVSVEVGQEDPRHLHEAQAALHELPLRAFPAVEQHDLRPAFHRHSAHVPLRRRPRSGRTEEHDLHGPVSRRATGAYRLWSPRENVYRRSGMPRRSSMRSIDGRSLDLADVVAVARGREPVRLAPAAAKRVDASRRALEKVVAKGALAYGIKTGFGELANVAISDADVRVLPGDKALAQADLEPLVLQSKEGLAIVNGTSVMAGVGALLVHDGLRLVKDAQIAASMSFEALRGSPKPFDDRLVSLKPQP